VGFSDQQYHPQNLLYASFDSFGKQKSLRATKSAFKKGAANFV